MLTLALISAMLASAPCDEGHDEHQHAFDTCFDAWKGLELGGAVLINPTGVTGSGSAALRFRGERESRSKAESTWFTLHRVGATEIRPVDDHLAVSVLGYSGLFRRHVREGVLLLPFTPPVRVPFPLDLSLMTDVLRYERRAAEGTDWSLEPVRLSLLFDPLRSSSSRFHLALGVTGAWRFARLDGVIAHELTPFTAATLFFDVESEDGLWLARGVLSGGWSFVAPDTNFTLRARGEIELSRVLVALNDQPISVFVRGTGAWRDAGARGASEWTVQAGLQVRLFSSR
jgi:hypothetical protein